MFNIKDLPPIERRPDGSLYRMDAKQRRVALRLIKGLCSYYDSGNCLYLDRGEEVTCPQSVSYSVCCKFFRHVLLKDKEGKGLEAAVFQHDALKHCVRCGKTFFRPLTGPNTARAAKRRYSGGRRPNTRGRSGRRVEK